MARRRLLTLLASSALLVGAVAGPAAASDLVAPPDVAPVEATVEAAPALAAPVAAAVEVVEQAVSAPAVEDAVDAAPVAAPTPTAPTDAGASGRTEARDDTAPAAVTAPQEGLVAAGGVTTAPPIDLLISLGGSEATPGRSPAAPVAAPAAAPVEATTDEVEAPLVAPAPAPATAATAPSVLAQALDDLPREGTPALALVALAALLAAGAGTLQTARVEAHA